MTGAWDFSVGFGGFGARFLCVGVGTGHLGGVTLGGVTLSGVILGDVHRRVGHRLGLGYCHGVDRIGGTRFFDDLRLRAGLLGFGWCCCRLATPGRRHRVPAAHWMNSTFETFDLPSMSCTVTTIRHTWGFCSGTPAFVDRTVTDTRTFALSFE